VGCIARPARAWIPEISAANFAIDDEGTKMNTKRVLTRAMLFATLVLPAIAAPAQNKSKADPNAALAEKWIAAWNSHNPDKMLPLFTDDIVYEDVAFGEVSHGSAELRKFFLSEIEGVPDLELKLERASIRGDHGTIEWTFSGTDKGVYKTGKKFSVRGVSAIDLRDGKISRNLDFYDSATIMRQVGVLPNPPADGK
jgi:steroid delta-isomerase-like uncharacterized protein